ncbi:MAG: Gfo/Idh/MocA family oxidoreductase [bacterium]
MSEKRLVREVPSKDNSSLVAQSTRREFLKKAPVGIAGAGLAMTGCLTAGTKGQPAVSVSRVLGANERIRMGVIGVGGRGTWGMGECLNHGAEMVALCDVYQTNLDAAIEKAAAHDNQKGKRPAGYKDYRELLDRDDIHAVYIGTPDHWHHDTLIDSVKAGKDVYVEKPFSHTIDEGRNMVKEVRKTDRIVQVGNHRRSGKHWAHASEVVQSGKLGKVVWIHVQDLRDWSRGDPWGERIASFDAAERAKLDWEMFLGSAPKRPFDPHRYFTWRWFWDYAGGLLTDIGAHQIDVAQWLLDTLGPKKVVANGGNYFFDNWETPDVVHLTADYGPTCVTFSVEFVSSYMNYVEAVVHGSDAALVVEHGMFKVIPRDSKDKEPTETWSRYYEGPDHVANFLDCVRTRKEPNSPVEIAHRVISTSHLGNTSYREKRVIEWDVKREREV